MAEFESLLHAYAFHGQTESLESLLLDGAFVDLQDEVHSYHSYRSYPLYHS